MQFENMLDAVRNANARARMHGIQYVVIALEENGRTQYFVDTMYSFEEIDVIGLMCEGAIAYCTD